MSTEDEIINLWRKELGLDKWYDELLGGQKASDGEPINVELAKDSIPWTQVYTAQTIKDKLGPRLSYVSSTATWYAWNGRIHEPCEGEHIAIKIVSLYHKSLSTALGLVEATFESRAQAKISAGADKDDPEVKNIKKLYETGFTRHRKMREDIASTRGREAVVKAMRSDFKVPDNHYDNDQDYLVVRNGVFDLKELRESKGSIKVIHHNPEFPVSRYMDIKYDPTVKYEDSLFMDYLKNVLTDNDQRDETIEYLMKVMGAAFMGESRTRTIINVLGPPGSGKSNFIDVFLKLGSEGASYTTTPNVTSIMKMTGTNFEQDQFRNKRFIAISEPSSTDHVDDEFLKRFTGDDLVMTRTLNAKSTGWRPQGLLFIASNNTLKINSRDEATVQRIKVIEFPYQFKENPEGPMQKKMDADLSKKMLEEDSRSAILNWLLWGMKKYMSSGKNLTPPSHITEKQAKISQEASGSLRWLEDQKDEGILCATNQPGSEIDVQDSGYLEVGHAYTMYRRWCGDVGEYRTLSRKMFEEDINKQHPIFSYGRSKRFRGLALSNLYHNRQLVQNRSEDRELNRLLEGIPYED